MNSTVLTVLAISLMIVSAVYYFIYTKKKKKNQQGDYRYKTAFGVVIILLVIPIIFQSL